MKGLMGRCLKNEVALERVRFKAEHTEDELNQLRSWKTTMEKKFELLERERKELEQSMGEAKMALKGKEKEIKNLKDGLRQAKEVAVREYRDSDALLLEPEDSFLQGFDDALRQVKKAYPDLNVSNIKMEDQAQTSILPVASDDTDDLFAEADGQGERESAPAPLVTDSANQPVPKPTIPSTIKVAIQPVAEQRENGSAQA